MSDARTARGAGGTPGGVGTFFVGLMMAVAGGYLFSIRVIVMSSPWTVFGFSAFGLSLVPLLAGIALLFFNGKSPVGWLLTAAGLVIIGAGILVNLRVYFQPTSLFDTVMMLGLLAGGVGLVARSLRPA